MTIVDVSKYNTVTNWASVAQQIDGVIIRVGYRGYGSGKVVEDAKFQSHAAGAKNNNIPIGLYFMSQAITLAEAVEEANFAVKYALAYGATLPIFIDSEDGNGNSKIDVRADKLTKDQRTSIAVMFCNTVKAAGFTAGVYASTDWFKNKLDVNKLLDYKLWVAEYNTKCNATHRVDAWQYTSKGTVSGISGTVDISKAYSLTSSTVKKTNPYTPPTRILKLTSPIMTGDDVKWLQFELGMDEKDIDGKFGSNTNKKLKAYLGF